MLDQIKKLMQEELDAKWATRLCKIFKAPVEEQQIMGGPMKVALVVGLLCVLAAVLFGVAVFKEAQRVIDEPTEPAIAALHAKAHALNLTHPFIPTPDGMPQALEVPRLQRFLTIAANLEPAFSRIENSDPVDPHDKASVDAYSAVEAKAVELWLQELERNQMSPMEFHSIIGTMAGAGWVTTPGELQKTQLARLMHKEMELRNLLENPRLRARAEQELPAVTAELAALSAEERQRYERLRDANAAALRAVQPQRAAILHWPLPHVLIAYGHALSE